MYSNICSGIGLVERFVISEVGAIPLLLSFLDNFDGDIGLLILEKLTDFLLMLSSFSVFFLILMPIIGPSSFFGSNYLEVRLGFFEIEILKLEWLLFFFREVKGFFILES